MKVIGLTGGTGTGKTTVAKILAQQGAVVIDADILAKEVVQKDNQIKKQLQEAFGNQILDFDGQLDRIALANIVFGNPDKLLMLNKIVHPAVYELLDKELKELRSQKEQEMVVVDIPIPAPDFRQLFDEIWVVDASLEKRVKRLMQRNAHSRDEAMKRINAQMSQEDYLRLADRVIKNEGTVEELEAYIEDKKTL
jgi:dephospho-CoA kinase